MKRLVGETAGWVLVVLGLIAIPLPGPGLLITCAGLVLLARYYPWARRHLDPLLLRALRGAAESVETVPRIALSTFFGLCIGACGVLWIVHPAAPSWWPLEQHWWLLGGWATGISFLVSSSAALGLIVYSVRRFYNKPAARLALEAEIKDADEADEERG